MDYLNINNSVSNNTNNDGGHNHFKIFTNLNLENIKGETQLNHQIETLKEKIREREYEIFELMKTQKDEFERSAREKDLEISNLVEKIVSDNDELKKQVLDLEIEKEFYKETLNDYKKNNEFIFFDEANNNNNKENNNNNNIDHKLQFNNNNNNNNMQLNAANAANPIADRLFFHSIKYINEVCENKKVEIHEKYELFLYNFIKEKSEQLSLVRNFNLKEYLNKFANSSSTRQEIEESLIPLGLLEDQFLLFENKVKLLYEDLKNKENQVLISENKYDLLTEENRALKRKFHEEKKFLLLKINEIKLEHEKIHKQIINKLEEEIREKKISLEKRVNEALRINEEIAQNLLKEKNQISEHLREAEKKYWVSMQDLEFSEKERKNLEDFITKAQIEIDLKTDELRLQQEKNKSLKLENELYLKTKEDLMGKLNQSNFKVNVTESDNKNLVEKLNFQINENEKLRKDNENMLKNQTERLNKQILEKERKTEEVTYQNDKLLDNIKSLDKKIASESDLIAKLNAEMEKLKLESNELKINNKNLMLVVEDQVISLEKHKVFKLQNEAEITNKDEKLKVMRDLLQKLEREHNNQTFEVEKLTKIKKDLKEESKKN